MLKPRILLLVSAVTTMLISTVPAWAPGTITFEEVMGFARNAPNLVLEIENAMKQENMKADSIPCSALRFGHHWTKLGGGRTLPFWCRIGKQYLTINSDLEFLDSEGTIIVGGINNPDVFEDATDVRKKTYLGVECYSAQKFWALNVSY
jgi:hypothetical protein